MESTPMDAYERGIFEELIASIESGRQAEAYDEKVRSAQEWWGPSAGYHGPNPEARAPIVLEDLGEPCPAEDD